ncbi:MAG: asparagine synthase (glutamine-hydrolyzing) [Pyrinomonadaceae bacterium]
MCGIAGIVGNKDHTRARESLGVMLDVLKHRGPNDEGEEYWPNAALGHRRLSIFDLSAAGHQPMISADGKTGIVFNGAIYNFLTLREELAAKGYKFKSQTDTEVLLHGFREWGIEKLAGKIEGMFAFAIWDDNGQTLYLVRDRLGVKPLIFSDSGRGFAFASTVRALHRAGYGGEISVNGVAEYLEFGFLTDQESIYENIKKVSPGTILTWKKGEVKTTRYWELSDVRDETVSFEEAVEETERLFLSAVEKRLQADVPIGALLSGGIDSSLVCWAIGKLGGDVTAFTVGVPGDEWDESSVASRTAKQLGIRHEILQMSAENPLKLDNLIDAYGEPFACASALGLLDISAEVKKHATVLITGDGGDDVFLGYPEHLHFQLAGRVAEKTPEVFAGLIQKAGGALPQVGPVRRANSFLSYAFGGLGAVTRNRDGLPVFENNDLLGERLTDIKLPHREIPLTSGEDLLSDFLKYDLKTRFVGEYLPKVDGGTMFHALEARSPFLDSELWEFASKLPFSLRLKDRRLKAVLREIVRRRISPELAAGKKQGFGVPVQRWLTGRWKQKFLDLMEDSMLDNMGWIKTQNAVRLLERSEKDNWAPRQLWFILVLESWLRSENK